jgi:hypothetical protein
LPLICLVALMLSIKLRTNSEKEVIESTYCTNSLIEKEGRLFKDTVFDKAYKATFCTVPGVEYVDLDNIKENSFER